jgi:LacI family transcriptional regulator
LSSIEPDFRHGGNIAMLMLLAVMRNSGGFRGLRHRTFGDLHVARRLSTKRLQASDPIVIQALNFIRKNACMGLTAAEVARIFPCSRRMADIRFTRTAGHSILDEIQSVRLDRAKQLLLNPNQDIKSISDFCGFRHPNSLRKFFLKETGMTLSAWRKSHLNKPLPDDLPAI